MTTTALYGTSTRRRPRRLVLPVALSVAAVGLALSAGLWRAHSASEVRAERATVSAYARGIHRWIEEGGEVVAIGLRPRLADLDFGAVTPAEFRSEAAGWNADLEQARRGLAAVPAPARLRQAAALYAQALTQYDEAVNAFVAASYAPPAGIKAAVTAAVPAAQRADRTYDRADSLLQAVERSLGLPTPPPLP